MVASWPALIGLGTLYVGEKLTLFVVVGPVGPGMTICPIRCPSDGPTAIHGCMNPEIVFRPISANTLDGELIPAAFLAPATICPMACLTAPTAAPTAPSMPWIRPMMMSRPALTSQLAAPDSAPSTEFLTRPAAACAWPGNPSRVWMNPVTSPTAALIAALLSELNSAIALERSDSTNETTELTAE